MTIGKIDPSDVISQLVYVTKTGKKYHKGDCRFLKTSKFAVKLEDAKKNYSPCSICKPPK